MDKSFPIVISQQYVDVYIPASHAIAALQWMLLPDAMILFSDEFPDMDNI